jgi:hypothetical protein
VLSLSDISGARWCSLSVAGWSPKNSGAANYGFGGALRLDLLGPPGRRSGCWLHDGEVAGSAVADFILVISGSGRCELRGQLHDHPIETAGRGAALARARQWQREGQRG